MHERATCYLHRLGTRNAINFSIVEAMRRAIKIVFHEHRIKCPYCRTALIYHLADETIQLAGRTCVECGKEFVIVNNIAKRLPSKKRPQKAKA